MKRRIKAILRCLSCSLILCTSLVTSGCNQTEAIPPVSEEDKMEGELTAYYVDYGYPNNYYGPLLPILQSEYPNLKINPTSFSSPEEFLQRTMPELNAGSGPDLFLLNFGTQMSFEKMSRNGTYLNLSPYMEADTSYDASNYFEAAMKAGQINGQQYILPIAFTQMNLFTSKEKMADFGVNLSENSTWTEIMDALSDAVDRTGQDADSIPLAALLNRNDFDTMFLQGFGMPIVDMEKGQVVLDKENYRIIADFVKKWYPISTEPFSQKINLVTDTQKYSQTVFSINNNGFERNYYYTKQVDKTLKQETVVIPFPTYNDSSKHVGQLYMYAAVNGNSSNKQLAYDAARALMDLSLTPNEIFYGIKSAFPIRKPLLKDTLENQRITNTGVMIDGQLSTFRYDEATNQKIIDTAEQIDQVIVDDLTLSTIINDCTKGYIYNNTKTFDECWDDLVNRLTLYINE